MIRFTRSARIAAGKNLPAMKWAKEITEFINKKYKIQMSVYLDVFGEMGTIRWFVDYADLAALEKFLNQINADQEYLQKLSQATDLFIRVFDLVMRTL